MSERRPRPHVPLKVQVAVAERQARANPIPNFPKTSAPLVDGALLFGPTKLALQTLLQMLFRGEPAQLDHDPPLRARPYNPKIKDPAARYTPNANDPDHLFWRSKEAHRVKTFLRGEHGQYSDVALIKRERRRERKKVKPRRRIKKHLKVTYNSRKKNRPTRSQIRRDWYTISPTHRTRERLDAMLRQHGYQPWPKRKDRRRRS